MINKRGDCYIIKQKNGLLLKFNYDSVIGIYYQVFDNAQWSKKRSVYKECFENFYVLPYDKDKINVFCQDICGDLILCELNGLEWKYKPLLHMKKDIIMPLYIRAVFNNKDIHLFYSLIDQKRYSEVLVHQIWQNRVRLSNPNKIGYLAYLNIFPYTLAIDSQSDLFLLNCKLVDNYQLISRSFSKYENRWGKEEIVYKSSLPYVDFTFCIEEKAIHYLFIIQDEAGDKVIYQHKDVNMKKNIILYQDYKIESCLLTIFKGVLWAFWICDDKLYGVLSTNHGQSFSAQKVYRNFDMEVPMKILYQEYDQKKKNYYRSNEIYVAKIDEEYTFFLNEMLEEMLYANLRNKDMIKCIDNKKEEVEGYLEKIELLKIENTKLKSRLKNAEEEIERLNNFILDCLFEDD